MFAAVVLDRRVKRLCKKNVKIEECRVGKAVFLKITAPQNMKKRRWQKLWRSIAPDVSRVILPKNIRGEDIFLPPHFNTDSGEFMKKIAANTALRILSASQTPASRLCVCLNDPHAEYCGLAEKLLGFAGTVRIATAAPERYLPLSEQMTDIYGEGFIVSAEVKSSDIIIDPEACRLCINGTYYTFEKDFGINSAGLSKYIPSGISKADFFAAITEYSCFLRLNSLPADYLIHDGEKIPVADIKI